MDEIRKEILTPDRIREDLICYEKIQFHRRFYDQFHGALTFGWIAVLVGAVFRYFISLTAGLWVGGILCLPCLYFIAHCVFEYLHHKKRRTEIINGQFSVATDIFYDIKEDLVYEPHFFYQRFYWTRTESFFRFHNGAWRIPNVSQHYEWSDLYRMTTTGLKNLSIPQDTFYIAALHNNPEISYVYPTKIFDYRES